MGSSPVELRSYVGAGCPSPSAAEHDVRLLQAREAHYIRDSLNEEARMARNKDLDTLDSF